MTCSTSAVADCCFTASFNSALHSPSCCRSLAMVLRRLVTVSFATTLIRTLPRAMVGNGLSGFKNSPFPPPRRPSQQGLPLGSGDDQIGHQDLALGLRAQEQGDDH